MLSIRWEGLDEARAVLRTHPRRLRSATRNAINDTARVAQQDLVRYQELVFDRPTPFIKRSIQVQRATSEKLVATVQPVYPGGKGVDPVDVLRAEVYGGTRKLKRSERAFQRAGILPAGMFMVPSKALLASDKADAFGNVKGSFVVQLISYLQAFAEQGYKANMSARRIGQLARKRGGKYGGPKVGPARRFVHIGGVEYFVSAGKLRTPNPNSNAVNRLAAGIWQRSGTGGSDVKPVFLFVRAPRYRVRYRMDDIFRDAVERELPRRFAQQMQLQMQAQARAAQSSAGA